MVKHEGSHVHVLQHSRGSEILVVKELCDLETSSLPTLSLRIQLVYALYRADQIQGYVADLDLLMQDMLHLEGYLRILRYS